MDTPLEPFWKTQSDFANSTDCALTSAYGYTYPEIAAAGNVSSDQLSQYIIQTIDNLYGGESGINFFNSFNRSVQRAVFPFAPKETASKNTVENILQKVKKLQISPSHNPHPQGNPHPVSHGEQASGSERTEFGSQYPITPENYRDWIVNVTLEKYGLGGSGRVAFFLCPSLDDIPENAMEWHSSPYYVGSYVIFAQSPTQTDCDNCKAQADAHNRVGGTVHLTKFMIRDHCPLVGDEPVEYLRQKLHWKCMNVAQGRIVPNEEVAGLRVVVQSATYTVPEGAGGRPVRGEWTRHAPVTAGKTGGVTHPESF